jgi:hypothetical protein
MLELTEKLELISITCVHEEYGVKEQTVSDIPKAKDELQNVF